MNDKTCAIICAYNEERAIADIVGRTKRQVQNVLVVDDGSTDRTPQYAIEAGAHALSHLSNRGKGEALRTGFSFCVSQGYDRIVTLDADGQHLPEEIPLFLDKLRFYSAAIGKRDFSSPCVPLTRRLGNRLDSYILSNILGADIPDPQNGFRAFHGEVLERTLAGCRNSGFTFEIEMLVRMIRNREHIGWVPIQTIYSNEIKSHQKPLKHIADSARLYLNACLGKI